MATPRSISYVLGQLILIAVCSLAPGCRDTTSGLGDDSTAAHIIRLSDGRVSALKRADHAKDMAKRMEDLDAIIYILNNPDIIIYGIALDASKENYPEETYFSVNTLPFIALIENLDTKLCNAAICLSLAELVSDPRYARYSESTLFTHAVAGTPTIGECARQKLGEIVGSYHGIDRDGWRNAIIETFAGDLYAERFRSGN